MSAAPPPRKHLSFKHLSFKTAPFKTAPSPKTAPSLLLPRRPIAWLGLAAAVGNALLRIALVPLVVTPLVDRVLTQADLSALGETLVVASLVVVGGAVMLWLQDAALGRAAAELSAWWREQLYDRLLAYRPGHLPGSSGGLAGRILTDLKDVETFYQFGLGTLVAESLTVLGIIGLLLFSHAEATGYLLLLVLPLLLILAGLGRWLEHITTRSQEQTEQVGAHLQEGLRHHEVVRAFGAQPFVLSRFEPVNRATATQMTRRSAVASLQIPTTQVIVFVAFGVLIAILTRGVAAGTMTPGDVAAYLTLVALLATPAQLLPRGYALLQQARAARTRLEALRVTPSSQTSEPTQDVRTPQQPTVTLATVTLAHRDDTPVLRKVTLDIKGPSLVAITGPSGSGKTTLLRALLGFIVPRQGEIYVGGIPLHALDDATLRRTVAYVPQETGLLRASVRDNLALGRKVTDDDLWAVLKEVGLVSFVRELPDGLGYPLGEDGSGLSGGQRQRLAVARALLSDPLVLLLDEPSANLDADSEQRLVDTLRRQARHRLVLVVAHRPAFVAAADRVIEAEHLTLRDRSAAPSRSSPHRR